MGRFAQDNGGDFTPPPAGAHVARSFRIVDVGTKDNTFEGKTKKLNQFLMLWELPNELMDADGDAEPKPFVVSRFYTNSLSERANLRKHLQSWRGKEFTADELAKFDLMNVLGKPCLLNVIHNEKGKAEVTTIMPLPKGMTCPPAVNPVDAFWLDEFSDEKFGALSDGLQRLVMGSDEWKAMNPPKATKAAGATAGKPEDFDADIPFVRNECEYVASSRFARRLSRSDVR